MKVIFRVDSSLQIGVGHLMRCLTLAQHLRSNATTESIFICRDLPGNLNNLVIAQGFSLKVLPTVNKEVLCNLTPQNFGSHTYTHWLGTTLEEEIKQSKGILHQLGRADWIVNDHYSLGEDWEQMAREFGKRIFSIDDLASRKHDCDLLLDQNYFRSSNGRYNGLVPASCHQLLGPAYALLRDDFRRLRPPTLRKCEQIQTLLVFYGGTDLAGDTTKAILALKEFFSNTPSKLDAIVLLGGSNPARATISQLIDQDSRFTLHVQTDRIAELMAGADLFIGAGGTTTWERSCLGLTGIVSAIAENQEKISEDLGCHGAHLFLGKSQLVSKELLKSALHVLYNSPSLVAGFRQRSFELLDGTGTTKVMDALREAS